MHKIFSICWKIATLHLLESHWVVILFTIYDNYIYYVFPWKCSYFKIKYVFLFMLIYDI
jgi:hypothetical protein